MVRLDIESARQTAVQGHLDAEGRQPDEDHEHETCRGQLTRHGADPGPQQNGRRDRFDHHRSDNDPAGSTSVLVVVTDETFSANPRHERVVDQLHVPDHAGHEQARGDLQPHDPRLEPAHSLATRRSSNTACAAARPDAIAPLIDPSARWSPHT